jgi:hypothetical protein|tara:strand:- start:10745 stop:10990 length:246 start_codon:yes stop_codon:yes gene_type:complete
MNKKGILVLLFFAVFFAFDAYSQGCSQCKMLAEQSSELDEASFGSNINMGILYLMTIPYILLFLLFRKRIFSFLKSLKKTN